MVSEFQKIVETGRIPQQQNTPPVSQPSASPYGTWGNAVQNPPQSFQNAPQSNIQYDPDAPVSYRDMMAFAQSYANQQNPQSQAAIELAASGNLDRIREQHADIFSKYGPELYGYLSRLPKAQWSVDNLKEVVNVVQGKHYRELAREEAQRLAVAPDAGVLRSNTGAAPNPAAQGNATASSPFGEALPAAYAQRLANLGITPQVLDEFCRREGLTPQQWIDTYGKTAITETGHGARANMDVGSTNPNLRSI